MFDGGVVGLDLACCGAGDDEDFDLVPPSANGPVELARLGPRGGLNTDVEFFFRDGCVGEDRDLVDMRYREVHIVADLAAGSESAVIWTNDLTADYVHENSAYSS